MVFDTEDEFSVGDKPHEQPVLTMGGNFYYRLHLIMLMGDKAALTCDLKQWYDSINRVYRLVKPLINERRIKDKLNIAEHIEVIQNLYIQLLKTTNPLHQEEIYSKIKYEEGAIDLAVFGKSLIERELDAVNNLINHPQNYVVNPSQRMFFKRKHYSMAQQKLCELDTLIIAKLNQHDLLMPKVQKRDMDYFTQSIRTNKKNIKMTSPIDFHERERNDYVE